MLGDPLGDLSKSRLEILWALGTEAMTVYTERYLARNPKLDATCPALLGFVGCPAASALSRVSPQTRTVSR